MIEVEERSDSDLHDEVGDADDTWLRHWSPGRWLAQRCTAAEQADCEWLEALAQFDTDEGWADAGTFSCAEWLMAHAGMARATSYEKVQVAHQLVCRQPLLTAYRSGGLSYSALRACCRVDRPDAAVDEAFLEVARAGTVADVERAVRTYRLHEEQEQAPPAVSPDRRLRMFPWVDGRTKVEVILDDLEAAEIALVIEAFLDRSTDTPVEAPVDESAAADGPGSSDPSEAGPADQPVDESAAADDPGSSAGGEPDPADEAVDESAAADGPGGAAAERRSYGAMRADAFMDAMRSALTGRGAPVGGADRYLVHLVARDGHLTFPDGSPLHPATAAAVACDTSMVTHVTGEQGEPLYLGRRTRTWNTAQRRSAMVRDGHRCRFYGCHRQRTDLHHHVPWDDDGLTDIDNAVTLCPRHHTLVHHGYRIMGHPDGELRCYDPYGGYLGATHPVQARLLDHSLLDTSAVGDDGR